MGHVVPELATAIATLDGGLYPICEEHVRYFEKNLRQTGWGLLPLDLFFVEGG